MQSTSKSTAPQRKHATSNLASPSSTHPRSTAAGRDGRPRAARRIAPARRATAVRGDGKQCGRSLMKTERIRHPD